MENRKIEIKKVDITLLDNDVNILAFNKLQYATIGSCYGVQCSYMEGTKQYNKIASLCKEIHSKILELNDELNK